MTLTTLTVKVIKSAAEAIAKFYNHCKTVISVGLIRWATQTLKSFYKIRIGIHI